jgi:hypothetical protein
MMSYFFGIAVFALFSRLAPAAETPSPAPSPPRSPGKFDNDEIPLREAPIQLAFGVMTYQKQGRSATSTYADFRRLMDVLYDSQNHVYMLHVDIKSEPSLLESIHNSYCQPKANCDFIAPRNIAWAGLTTGEMMLALMHGALEFDDFSKNATRPDGSSRHRAAADWAYFVLIGHESVPLYPLPYIERFLAHSPAGTNFMNCWPVEGYDFYGQWEDNTYRLQDIVIDTFDGALMEGQDYPRLGQGRRAPAFAWSRNRRQATQDCC